MKRLIKQSNTSTEVKSAYEAKGFQYEETGMASDGFTLLIDDVSMLVTSQKTYESPTDLDRPIEVSIDYGCDLSENVELQFNSSTEFLNKFNEILKEYKIKAEEYNETILGDL